ncbi:MAG TPA: hypothetical protein VFR32_01585 [Gaiellaceae bacterium]|nr:hypothetical protein [Gaiellaceae bacterium]
MRRAISILGVALAVAAAATATALAHSTPYSWTVPRAQLLLPDSTNIALPADSKASLDAELDAWLAKFRPLLLTAQADPDQWRLQQTYKTYIDRFVKARDTVNSGLSIDSTKCVGKGKALKGKRYKHFRCNATSYVLEIPNIELVPGADPALPDVVEGPRRIIGPLQAVFTVHVTGKTRMLSQRAS